MEIDEKTGTVCFKSLPEFFHRERSGAKSNTLRVVTQSEYSTISAMLPGRIVITNVVTDSLFIREISSIVVVPQSVGVTVAPGMVLILISWWA